MSESNPARPYALASGAPCILREPAVKPPRLLDRVRAAVRARHYSRRTEKAYVAWIRRYIPFHGKRHPSGMSAPELTTFLSSLAVDANVAASTQNQALSALLFLYREVLDQEVPWLDDVVRVRRPVRLPIVLTRDEVRSLLRQLRGTPRLMAILMYGSGLRVMECARLQVQDIDFQRRRIVVRGGKGDKDGPRRCRQSSAPSWAATWTPCRSSTSTTCAGARDGSSFPGR